jgi:site-specific DNA-methyltransferase (adenine-specific)
MLNDRRIRVLHDFYDAGDCFPGVEIKGGVCFFRWDRDTVGDCKIITHESSGEISSSKRPLLEKGMDSFLRHTKLLSIFHKVRTQEENSFSNIVSSNDPYGFDVREKGSWKRVKPIYSLIKRKETFEFYYNGWRKEGLGYVDKKFVKKGIDLIGKYRLFIPKAWGVGDISLDWLNPFIVGPDAVSTETYLTVGPFSSKEMAKNALSYTQTRFFHLMVSIKKITQNTMKGAYECVPIQDFSKPWTDEELYKKYNLTADEIAFIESMIKPME